MFSRTESNEEDPDDVAAIEHTKSHLGDYKLKLQKTMLCPRPANNVGVRRQTMVWLRRVHD